MLYDDKFLKSTPSFQVNWETKWDPSEFWSSSSGRGGVIVVGNVTGRTRNTINDSAGAKFRHLIITVKMSDAFARQYRDGKEVEVVQASTTKVRTGYLNSSYAERQARSDRLTSAQVHARVDRVLARITTTKIPMGNEFDFWAGEDELLGLDLRDGDRIRLKTRGDTPFIESIAKLEAAGGTGSGTGGGAKHTTTNYTGGGGSGGVAGAGQSGGGALQAEAVGQSWTDKVMAKGAQPDQDDKPLPGDELEGVSDGEWSD